MTTQPPRDGEPDPTALAQDWLDLMGDGQATHTTIKADDLIILCNAVLSHQRPQPKVEDAEVATVVRDLRHVSSAWNDALSVTGKAADLLERLAAQLAEAREEVMHYVRADSCHMEQIAALTERAEQAEAAAASALDKGIAVACQFSDIIHRLEGRGIELTASEDRAWQRATELCERLKPLPQPPAEPEVK